MKRLLGFVCTTLLICLLQGASSTVVRTPQNTMEVSGKEISLDCRSDTTSSSNNISWFFEQFSTNYTDTVVSGCVSTNTSAYETISTQPGQCTLVIKRLDGPYAGRYTCQNGAESPVSAIVGAIVSGPNCGVLSPDPIVVGNNVTLSCFAAISGMFAVNDYISNVISNPAGPLLASTSGEKPQASQQRTPDVTDWRDFPYFSIQTNITFAAKKPKLEQWRYGLNFTVNTTGLPAGSARNNPSYQYQWTSPATNVKYPPVDSSVKIQECRTPATIVLVGSKLTCEAESDPAPSFTWIGPNGTTTQGETVTVGELGSLNYTCIASNTYGSAETSCIVTAFNSGLKIYWSLSSLLLTGLIHVYFNHQRCAVL